MGVSAAPYLEQLQRLLPTGAAWPRAASAVWTRLLDAIAQELARVDARASVLTLDAVPGAAAELLPDWERVAGLPDNCSGVLRDSAASRRQALVTKLASDGGQSRAYFERVAADLGYGVRVEEHRPFRVGRSRAGEALSNGEWRFAWRVRAPETTVNRLRVGAGAVGERLATWGNADLECRIRQYVPAHTVVAFAYGALAPVALLSQAGTPLINAEGSAVLLENA